MTRTLTLATLFAAAACAAPAMATPSLGFEKGAPGTLTLTVTPSDVYLPSALATETAISLTVTGDLSLTGATIADPGVWDLETPGLNPFTGGVTLGLYTDLGSDEVFVSYGSVVLATADPTDLLELTYTGTYGTIEANGLVAQAVNPTDAVVYDNLSASITIPEPATALLALVGSIALAGVRR